MQSTTILFFNIWQQGLESSIQFFLNQIKERLLASGAIQTFPLLIISYVPDPNSPLNIALQAQHLAQYFMTVGMQVSCVPLSDELSLAQDLKKHHFALILCTPAYAKAVEQNPAIRSCLDRFGRTQKNALYPLLCEGGFNDTALKIVDHHFLIRAYQAILKPDPGSDPLRPLEAFIDIFLMLSGQQGLGILPAMLLKEKQLVEAEILYREALDVLKVRQAQLTVDYRLSCALQNEVESHPFKTYLPNILPIIQQNQDPGFEPILDSFLPSKAKISLLLCATTADVQLSNLALMKALQTKGLRVLSIDCAHYAGRASKDCVHVEAQALKLQKLEDLKSKPLIILLKGYQDLGAYDNLYVQNQLAGWPQLKVIVSCRADFFAHRGYLRCFLSESSDRRVEDLAVYKIPAFASLEAQKAMIPLVPPREVSTPKAHLSSTQIAQQTELRAFLNQLKNTWIEQGWLSAFVMQNAQVFISYAWEQDVSLKRQQRHLSCLAEAFRTLGLRPWLDIEQMTGHISEQMETNIAQSTLAIVVGSPRYLERTTLERGEKTNVQKEYEAILLHERQGNIRVLPMLFLGGDQNAAFPLALCNRTTCVDFRGIDEGSEYLEQMSNPQQGLIAKLLEIETKLERLQLYEQCYAAFQAELKLLVGKHLVLAINQAILESLEVTHRLKGYLKPFALVQEHLPLSDRFDLGTRFNDFLDRSQAKTFVALGNAGSGKTLFAFDVFRGLMEGWQSYKHSGSPRPQWLPLYISLRHHKQNPDACIQEALQQQFQLSEADIEALRQGLGHHQQLLFICDGYDEFGIGRRPNLSQQLADWPYAKLLITARPEHFDTAHGAEQCLAPSEGCLDLVYLSPFSEKEVQRFVSQHEQGQKTDTYQILQQLPGMMTVVNNPFLLSLVLQSLPQLLRNHQTQQSVSRSEIYEAFVQTWFQQETEGRELQKEDCHAFSEALAFELFKANTLSPNPIYGSLWAFFEDEAKTAFRDAAPLRYSAGEYMFIHKSLYEYFAAQHFWKSLIISKNFDTLLDTYPLLKQSGILEFLLEKLLQDAPPDWMSDQKTALSLSKFLVAIGDIFHALGKYATAQTAFQGSLSIIQNQDDLQESSELACMPIIMKLGNATCFLGDAASAKGLYERVLAIQERIYGEENVIVASTLTNLGIVLRDLGDPVKAKRFHERALALKERTYGKDHIEVAATLTNLGAVLRDLGEGAKARVTLERALAIKEQTYGVAHVKVAVTLTNLANVLVLLGELIEAKKLYERSLVIKEQAYGVEHVEVAVTLSSLGEALRVLGDAAGAKVVLERALAIEQRIYGAEHIHVASTLGNLGNVLTTLGDAAGAKAIYEQVLAIQQNLYGPEHVAVGTTLANLGSAWAALGNPKEAQGFYERALAIQEQTYGLEHAEVASTLSNLGNALNILGESTRSKVVLERALVIQQHVYGLEHAEVAATLTKLANTGVSLGNIIEARALYERALPIKERIHGGQHLEVASILSSLGNVLAMLGDPAQSKVVLERALVIEQRIQGPEHVEVAATLTKLGNALVALGDPIEAKKLYERALVIQERFYGAEHVEVAATLTNLGNALRILGDPARSKIILERALAIQERTHGSEHTEVASTLMNLGIALDILGKPMEAKKLYERALSIQERIYGAEHVQVATSLVNLGENLRVLGDPVGAKKLLERALVIQERAYGGAHAEITTTLMGLGNTLCGLGDAAGAKRFYERALAIQERTYGSEHAEVASVLVNLGGVLNTLEKPVEAKKLYKRALAIQERIYGVSHVAVAPTLTGLGAVLQTLKDAAGAKALYERALLMLENYYGQQHPQVAITLMNLGTTLYALGDAVSAKGFLKRALAIFEAHYRQDHAYVCAALANLSTVERHLAKDANRSVPIVDKRFEHLANRKIIHVEKLIKILEQCKTKQDGEQWPTPELALRRFAAVGSLEKVKALVEIVEDLDIQESGRQSKKTALEFAEFYGCLEVAQFLRSIIEKRTAGARNSTRSGILSFSKTIGEASELVSNELNSSLDQKTETEVLNTSEIEERKRFSMS